MIASSAESQRRNLINQSLPGSFTPKKALRSFFSVQRYRLTVGDKPLLPGTLSAARYYVTFWLSFPAIENKVCRRILRYLGYHCTSGCGEAGFPTRQSRPALNGRKRPQGFFWSEGTGGASDQLCSFSAESVASACKTPYAANGRSPWQVRQRSRQMRQARPSGLSAEPALRVADFRQADACLQTGALIAGSAESQR